MVRRSKPILSKKLRREAILKSLLFLPGGRRRQVERWVRGREEYRSLERADVLVVSCGKSGRTWLRTLLSRYFQIRFGLETQSLLSEDALEYRRRGIPRIAFSHDYYLRFYTGDSASKREYRDKRVVLLVRHPADVAVSQFFQWKHRMLPHKKWLNEYPAHGSDISTFDLVMDRNAGMPYVIDFLNGWSRGRREVSHLAVVRYEDMRRDCLAELRRVVAFLRLDATPVELQSCAEFASLENMKKLERENAFPATSRRVFGGAKDDGEDSCKVRRGKVGGWRDYADEGQTKAILDLIDARLEPGFGYRSHER